VPVTIYPGVTAATAAAALLGAPLMNDYATVSLSDQLTPLPEILARLEAAAAADFALCLYNPAATRRVEPFRMACEVLARHRSPSTPVGIVRAAYRAEQSVEVITLAQLPAAAIDMSTLIVVGNSQTIARGGRMVASRGYQNRYQLAPEGEPETLN
jgi:precorrin-3B C17-methyltransferase